MTARKTPYTTLAFLLFALGFPAYLLGVDRADAQDATTADDGTPVATHGLQLRCRVFSVLLSDASTFETKDATTEIGQWIAEQDGWTLHDLDFEVAQKATGFPQGWRQVCLKPVR